jgi:hypothetical protein
LTAVVLLAITGCASAGDGNAGVGAGVDHGEHPADLDPGPGSTDLFQTGLCPTR